MNVKSDRDRNLLKKRRNGWTVLEVVGIPDEERRPTEMVDGQQQQPERVWGEGRGSKGHGKCFAS